MLTYHVHDYLPLSRRFVIGTLVFEQVLAIISFSSRKLALLHLILDCQLFLLLLVFHLFNTVIKSELVPHSGPSKALSSSNPLRCSFNKAERLSVYEITGVMVAVLKPSISFSIDLIVDIMFLDSSVNIIHLLHGLL